MLTCSVLIPLFISVSLSYLGSRLKCLFECFERAKIFFDLDEKVFFRPSTARGAKALPEESMVPRTRCIVKEAQVATSKGFEHDFLCIASCQYDFILAVCDLELMCVRLQTLFETLTSRESLCMSVPSIMPLMMAMCFA